MKVARWIYWLIKTNSELISVFPIIVRFPFKLESYYFLYLSEAVWSRCFELSLAHALTRALISYILKSYLKKFLVFDKYKFHLSLAAFTYVNYKLKINR